MSLEMSVVPPVSHESCVSVEIARQSILLGPAPYVVNDATGGLAPEGMGDGGVAGTTSLPVPHRYSA